MADSSFWSPPERFQDYETKGDFSLEGNFLVSLNYNNLHYLTDFDSHGNLVWYLENEDKQGALHKRFYGFLKLWGMD